MSDHDQKLEAEKLAIERDRLALDRERFLAEDSKRAAETSKLDAERAAQESAKAKTDLETADLKKAWYLRPAFLTSLSLPVVIGTVLTGFLTYFNSVNTHQQQIEEATLKGQIESLKAQKEQAQSQLSLANQVRDGANRDAITLQAQNETARKEYAELLLKQTTLQGTNDLLVTHERELEVTVELGNLKEYIGLLTRDDPKNLGSSNRYVGEIVKEVQSGELESKTHKRDFLRRTADDVTQRAEIRALLYWTLFTITDDAAFPRMIVRLAGEQGAKAVNTFESLLQSPVFDLRDRTNFVCSVSQQFRRPTTDRTERIALLTQLFRYDQDATVVCRDPFIQVLIELRNAWQLGDEQSGSALYDVSVEGFLITVLTASLPDRVSKHRVVWEPRLTLMRPPLVSADALMALTLRTVDGGAAATNYRQDWVRANARLISVWQEPDLNTLRNLREVIWRKILKNEWVTVSEFD